MAIQRMDIILIAAMRSPKEAAIYTAATRFVALGQFGTQAIQQVLQPKFTALLANHERESLKDVYQISAAWSMLVVLAHVRRRRGRPHGLPRACSARSTSTTASSWCC